MIKFFADYRFITAIGSVINYLIHFKSISIYLVDGSPQNLLKKNFIIVNNEKVYLEKCDNNLQYLLKFLECKTRPLEEKQKVSNSVLTKFLNLKIKIGRQNFILYIVNLVYSIDICN